MTQEVTTRRGVVVHEHSPFMPDVRSRTKRVVNKRGNMMLVDSGTGEALSKVAGFWEAEEVDSARFVKLFVNGVRALAELSNAGARVFEQLYIEIQSHAGQDQVYLRYTGLDKNEKAISRSTFMRGMAELIDKKFLAAKTDPGWYWVNPDFIWNGDRLAFVKEYRRRGTPKPVQRDPNTTDMFSGKTDMEGAE